MTHSQECLAHLAGMQAQREAFEREFPNFCRSCGATGWRVHSDSVPYGSTNVRMDSGELCPECIGNDKCPQCGKFGTYDESEDRFRCENCGYDSDGLEWTLAGAPEVPDEIDHCICDAVAISNYEAQQTQL